jgi:hypothetical protein
LSTTAAQQQGVCQIQASRCWSSASFDEVLLPTGDLPVPLQNLDSSEISLTDVSHYFDSDPTKLVSGLRGDGKMPSSYIAGAPPGLLPTPVLAPAHAVLESPARCLCPQRCNTRR